MTKEKNVLSGQEWHTFLKDNDLREVSQARLYSGITYKYVSIWTLGGYYFTFNRKAGYRNISTVKRLIAMDMA